MNTTGMTVRLELGRRDFTPDFELTGSTADLLCLIQALERCDLEHLPPNFPQLKQELCQLLKTVRARKE